MYVWTISVVVQTRGAEAVASQEYTCVIYLSCSSSSSSHAYRIINIHTRTNHPKTPAGASVCRMHLFSFADVAKDDCILWVRIAGCVGFGRPYVLTAVHCRRSSGPSCVVAYILVVRHTLLRL